MIESPFDGGPSGVVFVQVVLGDLWTDSGSVFVTITPLECLHSLSGHVSGWNGVVCGWRVGATKKRKIYFSRSH